MNKLAVQSFLGIAVLALMMGLTLFLPAGTLHYVQAWWYLAIFFAGVIVITVHIFLYDQHLLRSRLKAGAVAEQRPAQKMIQALANIGFLAMYIIAGFDHRYNWSHVPSWLWMLSDVLLAVAMLLFYRVFRKNTFLSATIEVQQDQQVVSDGPYGVVRHPMYSAALLLFVCTPPALGSWWALLTLPLMVGVLVLRILDEEKALVNELSGYREYRRQVRYRLVPYVW